MSDLFVSYASEDREYVSELVSAFEAQGWTVWWDRHIQAGVSFDRTIERALDDSRCVVVVWSSHSLNSDWVRAEAAEGLERNILVPILLDDVRPPLLFRQKQAISLVDWKAKPDRAEALTELLPSISAILESYSNSSLPVSTQRSWALAPVANLTDDDRLSGAAFQVLSIAMTYLDGAFLYAADKDGSQADELSIQQVEALVEEEGLSGYITSEISKEGDAYAIRLTLNESAAENLDRTAVVTDVEDLVVALIHLMIEMAPAIQGRDLIHSDRLLNYMAGLNIEGLHCFSESFATAKRNDYLQTKTLCEKAIALCGEFIPAYRGLAIACIYLGQFSEAREVMGRAMREMKNESDRNQHFARGMYHAVFSEDHDKASTEFEAIVKVSPLDDAAINNLAVCRFYQLRFQEASELASRDLQLYPGKTLGLQNAAFYAMYAGDFQRADELARQVLERDSAFVRASVIRALIAAESGDTEKSAAIYRDALCGKPECDSILLQGLADLALAEGNLSEATRLLEEGIAADEEIGNAELRAHKLLMQLECQLSQGNLEAERLQRQIDQVFDLSDSVAVVITVALLGLRFGNEGAQWAVARMRKKMNPQARAYVRTIEAILEAADGNLGESIAKLDEANQISNLWLVRFCSYLIHVQVDLVLEAGDDLRECLDRPGEAVSAALDELPTFRYLHYLKSRG